MAQLSKIIGAVLRDMVLAQHEANMYAVSLEDAYKKNGRLERFSLPSVAMGEIDLSIRYGIDDDSAQVEQYEIDYPKLREVSQDLSLQLARTAFGSVLNVIQESLSDGESGSGNDAIDELLRQPDLQRKYGAFLGRRILKATQENSTAILETDGTVNENALLSCTLKACEEHMLNHKELCELFACQGGNIVRERAAEVMRTAVQEAIPKLLKDVNLQRRRLLPSMDVTVNSEELAKLPDECIHTIRFHVSPNGIRYMEEELQ